MVMPRAFSSGELSISSYFLAAPPNLFDSMGGDRRSQGGLAVVYVTNRANVYVRLGPLEFFLSHFKYPSNLHKNDAAHQHPHTDYRLSNTGAPP